MNMDDKQKQIEEMVEIMCDDFGASFFAEKLYDAGYRKQSDTVKEFVCKVLQIGSKRPLCLFNEYGEGYIDCIENIKKIAKEYGVEVEE